MKTADFVYKNMLNLTTEGKLAGFSVQMLQAFCELTGLEVTVKSTYGYATGCPFSTSELDPNNPDETITKPLPDEIDCGMGWTQTPGRYEVGDHCLTSVGKKNQKFVVSTSDKANVIINNSNFKEGLGLNDFHNFKVLADLNITTAVVTTPVGAFATFDFLREAIIAYNNNPDNSVKFEFREVSVDYLDYTILAEDEFTIDSASSGDTPVNVGFMTDKICYSTPSTYGFYIRKGRPHTDKVVKAAKIAAPVLNAVLQISTYNGYINGKEYKYNPGSPTIDALNGKVIGKDTNDVEKGNFQYKPKPGQYHICRVGAYGGFEINSLAIRNDKFKNSIVVTGEDEEYIMLGPQYQPYETEPFLSA